MNIVLYDSQVVWEQLLPLTFTRPIGELRIGILTISEKWKRYAQTNQVSWLTQPYLSEKFVSQANADTFFISSHILPSEDLVHRILSLSMGQGLKWEDKIIALRGSIADFDKQVKNSLISTKDSFKYDKEIIALNRPYDIFNYNNEEILKDIRLLKKDTVFYPLDDKHSATYKASDIYIEPGVKVRASILNAEDGPIYLGKNVQIQEGSMLKGPIAFCDGSVVNMGGKMRPGTTIGPYSKVGGEVSNVVIQGYSNKGHDGFLGNAVLGEWCNLGADTNASNMKNNYSNVKMWNYSTRQFEDTGKQFCGLIMGDHSKAGINTMFNTGSVVGVSCNIFDGKFPPTFIPSFSWGGELDWKPFRLEKAIETASKMLIRRNLIISEIDTKILRHIFEMERPMRAMIFDIKA